MSPKLSLNFSGAWLMAKFRVSVLFEKTRDLGRRLHKGRKTCGNTDYPCWLLDEALSNEVGEISSKEAYANSYIVQGFLERLKSKQKSEGSQQPKS